MKHEDLRQLYLISDELRALSNLGLRYSENSYDAERYSKILELSAKLYSLVDEKDLAAVQNDFAGNMAHFSPLAGAEAVLYENDQILLIKRHDDGLWAIPGGLAEVGETLSNAAVRELKEETRIVGRADALLGIFDSRKWNSATKFHMYHFLFLVKGDTSANQKTEEALDIRFFGHHELPPLSPGHDTRVPFVLDLLANRNYPYFD